MLITNNAEQAKLELLKKEIEVYDWNEADGYPKYTQFVIAYQHSSNGERYFDWTGDWIKESYVNGEYINPWAIRHDIFEVFAKHHLAIEWADRSQLAVLDGSQTGHRCKVGPCDRRNGKSIDPPMSHAAFLAMKDLSRIGAPVWDFQSYSHAYDPLTLPNGTQFVMTCEPVLDYFFADPVDAVTPLFGSTNGLHPDVAAIVAKFGLNHARHEHRYSEHRFRPKQLIAFQDPKASRKCRGV